MRASHFWFCLACWLPAAAAAFQPLVTDDTGTQGAGGNQVEFGYTRNVEKEPGTRAVTAALPFTYTRGLTDAVDLYAGGSYLRFSTTPGNAHNGSGNALAGIKWRFYDHAAGKLSLAFKPEIRFAVSGNAEDRGLGNGKTNAGAALLLTRETGFGAIHANLAVDSQHFELAGNRAVHRATLWRLSVAPVFELDERWRIAFDAGLITNPHRAEKSHMAYVEAGFIHAPQRNLDLAAGLIRDVDHKGHRVYLLTAGVTWRFR